MMSPATPAGFNRGTSNNRVDPALNTEPAISKNMPVLLSPIAYLFSSISKIVLQDHAWGKLDPTNDEIRVVEPVTLNYGCVNSVALPASSIMFKICRR